MPLQRQLKKGEFLFKEGEKSTSLFLIQSGGVRQCLQRDKKTLDLYQLGPNQFLGESCFLSQPVHIFSALATTETKVLEFSPDEVKVLGDAAGGVHRVLLKSLSERIKTLFNDVKSTRAESGALPCPPELISRLFAGLYFSVNHKGTKSKSGDIEIEWTLLKTFAQRMFGESPIRLEQSLNLLVKLGLAKLVMGPSPDDPEKKEVLTEVVFKDLAPVESFYELYQYFYFKPGKGEFLKHEDSISRPLQRILQKAENLAQDRFGAVSLDYSHLLEDLKSELGVNFGPDLQNRFEQKGLLFKRKTVEGDKVRFEFDLKEWKSMAFLWRVTREIDRWNELGFVDVNEDLDKPKATEGPKCGECGVHLAVTQKFCSECGAKNAQFREKSAA